MEAGETLPPPVRVLNEHGTSPIVLLCEHASRFIPPRYAGLGLDERDLQRHIAWDIGAADVAERISQLIDAPLVMAGYSRLLIDLNRPLGSATSIPDISEETPIPGNSGIGAEERAQRAQLYFDPFHAAVKQLLDERQSNGSVTAVVGIHSFTPVFKGVSRPWHAGILFRKSEAFGRHLVDSLGGENSAVAANEPYQIEDDSDYTVPVHGEMRGLHSVLVEIRQDLVSDSQGTETWSRRLAKALATHGGA
jgi:predicted N-formylglutamate amidohydrolase